MKSLNFVECTESSMNDLFTLRRTLSSPILSDWTQDNILLSDEEKRMLRMFQEMLILNRSVWNEQELAMSSIGPILALARFTEPYRFNLFAQRRITAVVSSIDGDVGLSGEPDGMIATGYLEPKLPMFALTQYKHLLDADGDPVGQTLAAMLVGQTLDEGSKPLYGCYVIGHNWYFLVLEGKEYTISQDYSALTDSVFDIFRILKALKKIIERLVPEPE